MVHFVSLLLVIFICINYVLCERKKIVCIYNKVSHGTKANADDNFKIENIQANLCTDLVYGFVGVDQETGEILSKEPEFDYKGGNIKKFNNLKQINTNLKTLVGVGGWEESSHFYSNVVKNTQTRQNLVISSAKWIEQYDFNGLILYWCFPGTQGGNPDIDKDNLSILLKELHREYKSRNLILGIMVHALANETAISYDIPKIAEYVDFIYVTGLDLYGFWSNTIGLHSALYPSKNIANKLLNVDAAITHWINEGTPPDKLVLGAPFFGRTFTLLYTNQTKPGAMHKGDGLTSTNSDKGALLSYNEFCLIKLNQHWTKKWDDEQKVPYAYKDDQWISYEDQDSIKEKAIYVNEKRLGGIGASFIDYDDFNGVCGEAYPLLKTMNSVLRTAESDFDFIINLSVFKTSSKQSRNKYTQLLYHSSEKFVLNTL